VDPVRELLLDVILAADGVKLDLNALITLLLGGGAIGTFVAIFKGLRSLRSGAYARQNRFIDRLERRAQVAEEDADYLRGVVGAYYYQLRAAGQTPDPPEVDLPSRRHPVGRESRRRSVENLRS
jgi:hypothetical protein